MEEKKNKSKTKWLPLAIVVLVVLAVMVTTGRPSENSGKSGKYTLPCGMELNFSDSVRNDATGKWKLSTTTSSLVPADYALEYYQTVFSADDEIHAIWNATLNTTTSIRAGSGLLFVDTHEYVKGEEHDAKLLFSGRLLNSVTIEIATGKEYKG